MKNEQAPPPTTREAKQLLRDSDIESRFQLPAEST
jgi:hypothetical protein